jgi:hypothetical protein
MWGTGATIWGTESLTQWDEQGELIGENEDGERIALPIEQFTVGVRVEGLEEAEVERGLQHVDRLGSVVQQADQGARRHRASSVTASMNRSTSSTVL